MVDFPFKITIPRRPRHLVPRPRLTELLDDIYERRLITISAPAGYGKTSLLIDFVSAGPPLPVCWYTLDRFDEDPWVFLNYLAAAIDQRFPEATCQTRALLGGDNQATLVAAASALARDIYAIGEELLIILDDWHLVDHVAEIGEIVAHLLLRAPNCRFILASRVYPSVPDMMLLAARRQMSGMDEELLRFTPDEVTAVLETDLYGAFPIEQITKLTEQSNGWITGILLTLQASRTGRSTMSRPLAERQLYLFLAEQVLDQQPPSVREFLLDTALLDDLTPERCDSLFEREDSAAMLDTLVRNHVFITEIEAGVLRYHPLFREFLQESQRIIDPQRFRRNALRIAASYQAQQQWSQAFDLCVTAGDLQAAQRVAAAGCEYLYVRGRLESLERWFNVLPLDDLDAALIRYKSLLMLQRGRQHEAEVLAGLAEARMRPGEEPVVRLLQIELARVAGRYEQAIELAQRLRSIAQDEAQRAAALRTMGNCHQRLGRVTQAIEQLQTALEIERQRGDLYALARLQHDLGVCYEEMGQFGRAEEHYSNAEAYWSTIGNLGARAMSLNNKGVVQHLAGHYREAHESLSSALIYAHESVSTTYQATVLTSLGDLYSDLQLWEQAGKAYANARRSGGSAYIQSYLDLAEVRLLLRQRYYIAAQRTLEYISYTTASHQAGAILVLRGCCACGLGDYVEASHLSQQAIAFLEQHGVTMDLALAYLLQAQIGAATAPADSQALRAALEAADRIARQLNRDASLVAATLTLRDLLRLAETAGWRRATEWLQRHQDLLLAAQAIGANDQRPHVVVRTLGADQVLLDGQPVAIGWQKAREIFYYLLAHPDGATPDELGELIWPDLTPERSRGALKTAIYQLRAKLPRDLIELPGRQRYRINRSIAQITYDVERFMAILEAQPVDLDALRDALDLYRGPYLAQSDSAWCDGLRADLEQRYLHALQYVAGQYERQNRHANAVVLYRRILAVDQLNEAAYAGLMRCQIAQGNRAAAIDQYHTLRRLLDSELGLDPGQASEVEQLYQQILAAS
jgi:ATP/maltotriose-dependent transcriptional regulator MalT